MELVGHKYNQAQIKDKDTIIQALAASGFKLWATSQRCVKRVVCTMLKNQWKNTHGELEERYDTFQKQHGNRGLGPC